MTNQTQLLIEILLDRSARYDERSDAAIDLGSYKDIRVLKALTSIVSDPNEDDMIVDQSAESLAEICVALNIFNESEFRKMVAFAPRIVFGFVMYYKPEVVPESIKNEFSDQ
ncbi:MAG: hypothetical protein Q8L98_04995 [Chlamydiales bacterium]|nr:hypothetical protein [Chlamydiales bacterium]